MAVELRGVETKEDRTALRKKVREDHKKSMAERVRELVAPPMQGRYADWEMERYLAADALSASTCKDICPPAGDPAEALRRRLWKGGDTPATILGTTIHTAILEPERFDMKYLVTPTRGAGLAAHKAELREAGYTMISQKQMDIARTAREQVHAHPLAAKLLAGVQPEHVEQTFFYEVQSRVGDGVISVGAKMRADLCRDDIGCWVDIKSTRKIDPYGFSGESAKYDYDLTKAWYQKGIERCTQMGLIENVTDYLFLCIENEFPCRVEVYEMGNATTALGLERLNEAISAWGACQAADEWPSLRGGEVRPFDHPDYAFKAWGEYLAHKEE